MTAVEFWFNGTDRTIYDHTNGAVLAKPVEDCFQVGMATKVPLCHQSF
jgi:hypothetical protein